MLEKYMYSVTIDLWNDFLGDYDTEELLFISNSRDGLTENDLHKIEKYIGGWSVRDWEYDSAVLEIE